MQRRSNPTRREGSGETTHYDDIGLWKLVQADTGRQLVMRGGREAPIVFRIDGPDVVTPLDPVGEPWRLHDGEIVGFTPEPGVEYRLRILEDTVEHPPADGSSKRWFLDLVVNQRVVRNE